MASEALDLALALHRAPTQRFALQGRPLPVDIGGVIQLASGNAALLDDAAQRSGQSAAIILDAVRFYLQHVLFEADADAYRTLGLDAHAADRQVREHYRWLQAWLHPDRRGEEWEALYATRVNWAWRQLRSESARQAYDLDRAARPLDTSGDAAVGEFHAPVSHVEWKVMPAEPPSVGWRGKMVVGVSLGACALLLHVALTRDDPMLGDGMPNVASPPVVLHADHASSPAITSTLASRTRTQGSTPAARSATPYAVPGSASRPLLATAIGADAAVPSPVGSPVMDPAEHRPPDVAPAEAPGAAPQALAAPRSARATPSTSPAAPLLTSGEVSPLVALMPPDSGAPYTRAGRPLAIAMVEPRGGAIQSPPLAAQTSSRSDSLPEIEVASAPPAPSARSSAAEAARPLVTAAADADAHHPRTGGLPLASPAPTAIRTEPAHPATQDVATIAESGVKGRPLRQPAIPESEPRPPEAAEPVEITPIADALPEQAAAPQVAAPQAAASQVAAAPHIAASDTALMAPPSPPAPSSPTASLRTAAPPTARELVKRVDMARQQVREIVEYFSSSDAALPKWRGQSAPSTVQQERDALRSRGELRDGGRFALGSPRWRVSDGTAALDASYQMNGESGGFSVDMVWAGRAWQVTRIELHPTH